MSNRSNSDSSATNAESRPLNVRARPGLRFQSLASRAGRTWVVKDPLAMNYVQLRDEEYTVLRMLDGQASLRQVKERLEQECFPVRVSLSDVYQFLAKLQRADLVVVDAFGQDQPLLERRRRQTRSQRLSRWSNPLALRFPGVDPSPLLDRIYPLIRWAFSRAAMAAGLLLICTSLLLVAVQFDDLVADLPVFAEFVAPRNVLMLAAMLVFAKGLHELAHGLTCKHFGGACHEIGVMFLVFTPCLYCNVSDAWTFSNKWHRIAVSLAGIYAELLLAAACTLLWWFSEPGLLHWACLNAMFLCCVSTLLINGNPLLKYDGYYALSDWLGIPNLRQQAGQAVEQLAAGVLWGIDAYSQRLLPTTGRRFLVLYWVASVAYRCLVVVAILWSLHELMKAYQLESVANLLAAAVVIGMLFGGAWGVVRMLKRARARRGNHRRAILVTAGSVALLCSLLFVPLPAQVRSPAILWPAKTHDVYVSVPGTLTDHVTVGERVTSGQPIAQLVSLELEQEVHTLAGRLNLQRTHVRHLELRRAGNPAAGNELPTSREVLADFEAQYRERQSELQRLTITASLDGVVLPPPTVQRDLTSTDQLSSWHGTPLEARNQGAFLETGTLLCHVGDLTNFEALLAIDETVRHRVRSGQRVQIRVAPLESASLSGTIIDVARGDLASGEHDRLARSESLLAELGQTDGSQRSLCYARVALDDSEAGLCGVCGTAEITTASRSLAQRTLDYLSFTFRFRL